MKVKETSTQRLMNQYDEAIDALKEGDEQKVDLCTKAILINKNNGVQDYYQWHFIFQGKKNSHLQGGNYKIKVKPTIRYPFEHPQVTIMDGFEHYHVFTGGKVCYKLLNKQNWKINYTIPILVNGIIKMLHSDPQLKDPASTNLPKLIQRKQIHNNSAANLKNYNQFLRNQSKRFKDRYWKQIQQFNKSLQMKQ